MPIQWGVDLNVARAAGGATHRAADYAIFHIRTLAMDADRNAVVLCVAPIKGDSTGEPKMEQTCLPRRGRTNHPGASLATLNTSHHDSCQTCRRQNSETKTLPSVDRQANTTGNSSSSYSNIAQHVREALALARQAPTRLDSAAATYTITQNGPPRTLCHACRSAAQAAKFNLFQMGGEHRCKRTAISDQSHDASHAHRVRDEPMMHRERGHEGKDQSG